MPARPAPFFALAAAALALAACGQTDTSDSAQTAADARPLADLALRDASLILPAVAGRPGVVYGTLTNAGARDLAVRSVAVKGAGRTELHASMMMDGAMTMGETGPQLVPAKGAMELKTGGLHIMVFDLASDMKPGTSTTLTVTVAGGDSKEFSVPVRAAGDPR